MLEQVRPLFSAMYREMKRQGLLLPLADDGADRWLNSIMPTLGRFGIVMAAAENGRLAGFAHGSIKFLPDYLGSHKTGVITHIYVQEASRDQHIGLKLVSMLEEWFREKQVYSVELQVIAGNDARLFWEKAGFRLELHQYRKMQDPLRK